MALTIVIGPSLVFGLAVLLWRQLVLRGSLWLAGIGFAALMVCFCFAMQRLSVHSTFGNPAYSQMDFLPILQTASLAGVSGVTFLLFWLPGAVVAAIVGMGTTQRRLVAGASAVLVVGAAIAFGSWRLAESPAPSMRVGLIAADTRNGAGRKPTQRQVLIGGYAAAASDLIAQGAQLVILPEKMATLSDPEIPELDVPLKEAARRGAVIAVGVERHSTGSKLNETRVFSRAGELRALYEKHHMLPPFESDLVVGTERSVLNEPAGKLGVAICKDMDFPLLSREYGNDGVGLLIVSAWDFVVDGWLHSRMAVMRGVESGFSIARSANDGLLMLSDNRGRVLAEKPSSAAAFSTLLGTVPVHHDSTLYARWGDWFSWLATAALIGIVLSLAMQAFAPRLSSKLSSRGKLLHGKLRA